MTLVRIHARRIRNSSINLHLHETRTSAYEFTPIYLTYADSDAQALYAARFPDGWQEYKDSLAYMTKLLLLFKPPVVPILVSPSSIIQSPTTAQVLLPFLLASQYIGQHFRIPARESGFLEYVDKRRHNLRSLKQNPAYLYYYDHRVLSILKEIPTDQKRYFSGSSTIENWTHLLGRGEPRARNHNKALADRAHEMLPTQAFVFETALSLARSAGLQIKPIDMRATLLDAYFTAICKGCAVPTAPPLRWDPCPANPGQLFYHIPSMIRIIDHSRLASKVARADPRRLHDLMMSARMNSLRIKYMRLHGVTYE